MVQTLGGWFRKAKPVDPPNEAYDQGSLIERLPELSDEGKRAQDAGDLATAIQRYTEALALDTESSADAYRPLIARKQAEIAIELGHIYRDQGDAAAAENAFRQAAAFDEAFDHTHYFLGLLFQRNSRREAAAEAYFHGLMITNSPRLREALEELDYSSADIDAALSNRKLPEARSIPDDIDFPPRQIEDLHEKVKPFFWFHSVNLGDGIITPGAKTRTEIAREAEAVFAPVSLRGKTVADIGAWNGGFTIEAMRRGPDRLLAVDEYAWSHPELRGKETFDLVMSRLGIDVETKQMDVVDLSVDNVGKWQVVLFLGVFYHLVDPIAALRSLSAITEEVLILETHLELRSLKTPAMAFYPNNELNGDPTNWWAPNAPAVEAMLKVFGFEKVLTTANPVSHGIRGIFHAFKTEAIYHEHHSRIVAERG